MKGKYWIGSDKELDVWTEINWLKFWFNGGLLWKWLSKFQFNICKQRFNTSIMLRHSVNPVYSNENYSQRNMNECQRKQQNPRQAVLSQLRPPPPNIWRTDLGLTNPSGFGRRCSQQVAALVMKIKDSRKQWTWSIQINNEEQTKKLKMKVGFVYDI
jgi:hypothetical protein